MGVTQSQIYEDMELTLKLLRQINLPVFQATRDKLTDLSRKKCKMNLTKFELLLILQMNAREVKQICQFITNDHDPQVVDINSLFVLLTLTNQNLNLAQRVKSILKFIAFDDNEAEEEEVINVDELKFVFQIGYQLLQRISDVDLVGNPQIPNEKDPYNSYGSEVEGGLVQTLYGTGEEAIAISSVVGLAISQPDIQNFLSIFSKGKVISKPIVASNLLSPGDPSGKDVGSDVDVSTSLNKSGVSGRDKKSRRHDKNRISQNSQQRKNQARSKQTQQDPARSSGTDVKGTDEQDATLNAQLQETDLVQTSGKGGLGTSSEFRDREPSKQTNLSDILDNNSAVKLQKSAESLKDQGNQSESCQEGWLPAYTDKMSPHSLLKMSKKVLEIRNENVELIKIFDQSESMQKYGSNIQLILDKNFDFYASKQLMSFMRTMQQEKASFELAPGMGNPLLKGLMSQAPAATLSDINWLKCKRVLRNNFEEFIQQMHMYLKWQHGIAKHQMTYFFATSSSRGAKRSLEKKKFELLGQIQSLKQVLVAFLESFNNEVFSQDRLFYNGFGRIANMYKSEIDQEFLLKLINLKNQKRESKRFINFLIGAQTQLQKVTENELLVTNTSKINFPSIYHDAKRQVEAKLDMQQNQVHLSISQQYQHQKLRLINYSTQIGHLKTFSFLSKNIKQLQNSELNSQLRRMLEEQIYELGLQLEKVDIELITLMNKSQIKQFVYKSYYHSLGQLSVIKCGIKGLDFSILYDYFALDVIRQRTYESQWLLMDIKDQKEEKMTQDSQGASAEGSSTSGQFPSVRELSNLYNLQMIKYLNDCMHRSFDPHTDKEDILTLDRYNQALREFSYKFKSMAEKYVQLRENEEKPAKPQYQNFKSDFISSKARSNIFMIYKHLGCEDQFQKIYKFQETGAFKKLEFFLDFNHEQKKAQVNIQKTIGEFDHLPNFIYDFVPFNKDAESTDATEPEDVHQRFNNFMNENSTSFRNIRKDDLTNTIRDAHLQTSAYLDDLLFIPDGKPAQEQPPDAYLELFKQRRNQAFGELVDQLLAINRGDHINCFNLQYLSLPMEHSLQYNYWAYQTIKLYIKDQQKNKMMCDINLIANANGIQVSTQSTVAMNMQEINQSSGQELINITQGSALGQPSGGSNQQPGKKEDKAAKKLVNCYEEVIATANNTEFYDKKGKQSLLNNLANQLNYQINKYNVQISIFQDLLNKSQEYDKDMYKVKQLILSKTERFNDKLILQEQLELYEKACVIVNELQDQKQADYMITGAVRFINQLKEAFMKEISTSPDRAQDRKMMLTEFLQKLATDITTVQEGIQKNNKAKHDELLRKRDEKMNTLNKQKTSKMGARKGVQNRAANASPGKKQASGAAVKSGDVFQIEMSEASAKILDQITQMWAYSELQKDIRTLSDSDKFLQQIKIKLEQINRRKDRLERLLRYCKSVNGLAEGLKFKLENYSQAVYMAKGANIITAVLSENMANKFDIYLTTAPTPTLNSGRMSSQNLDTAGDESKKQEQVSEYKEPKFNSSSQSLIIQASTLTQQQKSLNYLINFLQSICFQDDYISSVRIVKQNSLFQFTLLAQIQQQLYSQQLEQLFNLQHALNILINIYEIKFTPITKYLENYDKKSMYIKRDLFKMITTSDSNLLMAQFHELMNHKTIFLEKNVIAKIDEIFGEAQLEDEEQMDFNNAQTKIRRKMDQNLRTYRKFLENETNKKLSEVYSSSKKQQEIKLTQCITALQLLIKMFYIKKLQLQEDFEYGFLYRNKQNQIRQMNTAQEKLQEATGSSREQQAQASNV